MSKSGFNLINFVKQSNNNCDQIDRHLDGNEIKEFYQKVVSSDDPLNEKIKREVNRRHESVKSVAKSCDQKSETKVVDTYIKLESIFKFCQNGDLEECRKWLRKGFDVNTRDQFLWTPLMCTSCGGHEDIVRLFLDNKADIEAKEKTGRTALDLAVINGHQSVCQLIIDYKKSNQKSIETKGQRKSNQKSNEGIERKNKRCDVCRYEYKGSDVTHNCSIVHQISLKSERKFNKYFEIPEKNRGFQMLLRSGWTRDSGLGPDGSGRTAPIKTVLKRDRKGLGISHDKPRVTHTDELLLPHVRQSKSSIVSQRKRSERRLKRIEIKFRRDFK